jgi:hypothetical protein
MCAPRVPQLARRSLQQMGIHLVVHKWQPGIGQSAKCCCAVVPTLAAVIVAIARPAPQKQALLALLPTACRLCHPVLLRT